MAAIRNDRELAVTLLWIKRFRAAVNCAADNPECLDERLGDLQLASLENMATELKEQAEEYVERKRRKWLTDTALN